jgi:hypothetical protein
MVVSKFANAQSPESSIRPKDGRQTRMIVTELKAGFELWEIPAACAILRDYAHGGVEVRICNTCDNVYQCVLMSIRGVAKRSSVRQPLDE